MRAALPLTTLILLALPATLQARFLVSTGGSTVLYVGDPIPGNVPVEDSLPPGYSVGYRHDSFGLFWVDFWTWDGGFCLYGGRMQPRPISADQAASLLGKETREMTAPFGYRYPPGAILVAGLLALVIAGLLIRRGITSPTRKPVMAGSIP